MNYTSLDLAMHAAVPVLPVPRHGQFIPLVENGHRFLVASDGLYVEIRREWLHALWPVAVDTTVAKPYGFVDPKVDLAFGRVPEWIRKQFEHDAALRGNVEIAACVVWSASQRALRYLPCEALHATACHIEYRRPAIGADESLVIDLHSHGHGTAFFSHVDDRDDANEVKIAGVLGTVNTTPTWKFRLCLNGIFIDVASPLEDHETQTDIGAKHA